MEQVVNFGQENNLVGILNVGNVEAFKGNIKPTVIILNSGLVHRVGPNRVYVKLARCLSEKGLDVLRFDFSGIGDSSHRKDNLPFTKSAVQEVKMAMDWLGRERLTTVYILIGICSGADVSFRTACEDPRVVGVVPINLQPPQTATGSELATSSFYIGKASTSLDSWVKFFSGKSNYKNIGKAIAIRLRLAAFPKSGLDSETKENVKYFQTKLKIMRNRGLKMLMISSKGETGAYYLRRLIKHEVDEMVKRGYLHFEEDLEADHMFTPLIAQAHLVEIISNWISDSLILPPEKKAIA